MSQKYIQISDGVHSVGVSSSGALITEKSTVSYGTPVKVSSSGTTIIYTPAVGKGIRLRWFAMATPDTNTATVIVNVTLSGKDIYIWPLGSPGAFMHSSIRDGDTNGVLSVTLSATQDVYFNMDIEEV